MQRLLRTLAPALILVGIVAVHGPFTAPASATAEGPVVATADGATNTLLSAATEHEPRSVVPAGEHEASEGAGHENPFTKTFLWIAIVLVAAKLSSLVEKVGQPSVLGELIIGVVLGNLALVGVGLFEPIKHDGIIEFLAELGVVILLFQIGLESNVYKMRRVGVPAFLVAVIGVVLPFVIGAYLVGPWLLPGLSSHAYLFLGATLTATSVGITARVFRDLGKLQTSESQIVLGAAVIDDVLGLILLAVVSALITVGSVSLGAISWIVAKSVLFLIGSIVVGLLTAPSLGRLFSRIHSGVGMKFTLAVSFGLVFAFAAGEIGLAPIVGAFAAGLVLDPVHFRHFKKPSVVETVERHLPGRPERNREVAEALETHAHRHVEDLIEPLSYFLVPIFFVVTGMNVRLETLFDASILLVALGLTLVAFIGKILAGIAAGRGNNRWIVGWGMVPRGEVGLIFATIGRSLGVVSDEVFSVIVIMIILTTLIPPLVLTWLIRRRDEARSLGQPTDA